MNKPYLLILIISVALFLLIFLMIKRIKRKSKKHKSFLKYNYNTPQAKSYQQIQVAKHIPLKEVNLSYKFKIINQIGIYNCYYFDEYYPLNKYPNYSITSAQNNFRTSVWRFKDGNPIWQNKYIEIISSCLINQFGKEKLKETHLIINPASTKSKTEIRFKNFIDKVCHLTGMQNGYILVHNKTDRVDTRIGGGSRNESKLGYINIDPNISGKNIILFDDITTSGHSFLELANKLTSLGVKSINGVFIGKTVSKSRIVVVEDLKKYDAI